MPRNIIQLENVHKEYVMGDATIHTVENANIGIEKGEFVAASALGTGLLKASFSWALVAGALSFSFAIGALSEIMPAIQASRLKPVDALRWE